MSLLVIEGFDHYNASTWAGKAIFNLGGINTSGGRYSGGGCWTPDGSQAAYVEFGLGGNHQEVIVGLAVYLTGATSTEDELMRFIAADGTVQGSLHVGSGNVLYVTRGTSTIIGTGTTSLSTDTWYYIECRYKVDNSAGEVEVRINGVVEFTLTSVDTRVAVSYNSLRSLMMMCGRYASDGRMDDLYILETGSSPNDDFLGDVRVDTLAVDADGTTNDWTAQGGGTNYEEVDDAEPDSVTYNYASTDGDVDLFGHVDLSQVTDIFGIQISADVKKSDASNLFARLGVRSGGTNYWGTIEGVGLTYSFLKEIFETDPNTTSAWTRTNLNSAEIGIQRVGVTTTPAPTTLSSAPPTTAAPTTLATTPAPTTLATTAAPTTL